MRDIRIVGDKNISNTGVLNGDCIVDNIIINLELDFIDLYNFVNMTDKDKEIVNMMAETMGRLAQAELAMAEAGKLRDEADKLRAEADKNNSIANLNYSKIMLDDWDIIKQLLNKLK